MPIVIVLLIVIFVVFPILGSVREKKFRARYEVHTDARAFQYLGGLSGVRPGLVYAWRDEDGLKFVAKRDGTHKDVPFSNIVKVQFNSDVQTVTTGGGRSIGGAIVGDVIAGPIGAIVGSKKKATTKTIDRSTVDVVAKTDTGLEATIMFKGSRSTYNKIAEMVGASI